MTKKPTLDEVIEENWGSEVQIRKAVIDAYPNMTREEFFDAMKRVSSRKMAIIPLTNRHQHLVLSK